MTEKKEAAPKAMSKTEVLTSLAEATGLTKKQISGFLDELSNLVGANLGKKGPGLFIVPGLMKIKIIRKPATKARKGISPFTGQEMMFKAKPARNVVKVLPLKGLKSMV